MSIPFTQYLRPDGRKTAVEIDMPPEVEALAQSFIEAGGRYECEELRTGDASFTAVHPDYENGERDLWIEVVPNGPDVPAAVERLVRKSYDWMAPIMPEDA